MWRKTLFAVWTVLFSLGPMLCAAGGGDPVEPAGETAFPAARGFGTATQAGRGGRIVRVTTLDPAGPGSLRAALSAEGPRIVVFEVGGVIDLAGKTLRIIEPFVTVAGQTAPAPGITVIGGGIFIAAHDVLIRHIRVRPGDRGRPKRCGWEPDGISTSGGNAFNIVIDHCSVSWAVDENVSASGPRTGPDQTSRNVTISNCIIAEGLDDATHSKGRHSKGSLIHDFCREIAVIGNLYAHNSNRNPYFKAHTTGVVVNNVIYNPGTAAVQVNYSESEWRGKAIRPGNCRIAVVGNVLLHGLDTRENLALVASRGSAYVEGNIALRRDGSAAPMTSGAVEILAKRPVWPEGLEALPAEKVLEHVVRCAGARPADRDAVDRRIIASLLARTGRIIDSQEEVGGYPEMASTRRALDPPEENVARWLARLAAGVEAASRDEPRRSSAPLEIVYVANEGFLIRTASGKILIDALFGSETIDYCDVPSKDLQERMVRGLAPFDKIDLVLVTHAHRDHFDAVLTGRHLDNNPRAVLVCPQQAMDRMKAEYARYDQIAPRVRALDLALHESLTLAVNGIGLHVFRLRHSPYMEVDKETGKERDRHRNVQNLAFLAELGKRRILHVGDAVLSGNGDFVRSLRLEDRRIDVLFLEFFDQSPETASIVDRHLRPRSIIFMHLPPGESAREKIGAALLAGFPRAVLFEKPLESRSF